jgi:hypothetical protein
MLPLTQICAFMIFAFNSSSLQNCFQWAGNVLDEINFHPKQCCLAQMASAVYEPQELLEPARKRQKLSPPSPHSGHVVNNTVNNSMSEAQTMALNTMISQRDREAQAGILCFVNESNPGFSGILKQR